MEKLKIEDVIDLGLLQQLQDHFAQATGVASLITSPEGKPLTIPSNFCRLCSEIIRQSPVGLANCMSSDALLGQQNLGCPRIQPCLSGGLFDAGVSINVEGEHLANWLIGQVRNEITDVGLMLSYADKIGVDRETFLEAWNEVPVMSIDQFKKVVQMLHVFVNQLTEKAHSNLLLKRLVDDHQKKVEALEWEQTLMDALMENIPDHIYFKNRDSQFIRINRAHQKRFGLDYSDQAIGKTDFDFFSEQHARQAFNDEQIIIRTGKTISIEEKETWFNKPDTWVSTIKSPLKDKEGNIIGTFGISRDITEKKKTENQLVENEERLRGIIESIGQGLVIVSKKLEFIYANPMAEEIFGEKKGGLLGKTLFDYIEHENSDELRDNFKHRNYTEKKSYEIDIIRSDGQNRTLLVSSVPRKDFKGTYIGFYEVFTDITDRKIDEQIIRDQNVELQTINAQKDKLFSIIAHDLRAPFNAFLGLTELLEKDLYNMSLLQVQEMAANMRSSATKIYNLLTNLLEWSRLQRGLATLSLQPVALVSLFDQCLDVLMTLAQNKSITVECSLPEDLIVVVDINMIQISLQNLLSNAIKFTPEGGRIMVRASQQPDDKILVEVTDTGIGMDEDRISRLFQIDQKTNRLGTNGEPSTGLGLIVCKEFIEKHGGRLWVESKPDQGSTFFFTLPASSSAS